VGLKIDLRVGESVSFDEGRISVTLLEKSGQRARLDIVAAPDVRIDQPRQRTADAAKNGLTLVPA
jgi:hypothetical protein